MRPRATKYETLTNIRNHFVFRSQSGQALLTAVIFLLFASASILLAFSSIALRETRSSRIDVRAKQSYFLSEAGVEDVLYRIRSAKQYSPSETLSLEGSSATVVTSASGTDQVVAAEGSVAQAIRRVRAVTKPSAQEISFRYGAQVGEGGLEMGNNARVIGSVYANGSISGAAGTEITGDAFAAGAAGIDRMVIGGDAQARQILNGGIGGQASASSLIDDTAVAGDARADTFDDSVIGGNAFYRTSVSDDTVVLGSLFQLAEPPSALPVIPLPIATSTIADWKQEASSGGTCGQPECRSNGDFDPSSCSVSLGPKKIAGNLILDASCSGGQLLTVTGTIWVTGNIDISNNARIVLSSAYGTLSGVVLTDGWIHLSNNGQFRGSGTAGSYLMLLSTATGGGHHGSAIDLHNNATGAIFYAGNGMIFLHQNVAVIELVGYRVHLENNAELTYEQGLVNARFSAGPTGGLRIRSWNEVK